MSRGTCTSQVSLRGYRQKGKEESEQRPEKVLRWHWDARDGCGVLMSAGAETLGFMPVDMISEWKSAALPQGISKAFYQIVFLAALKI